MPNPSAIDRELAVLTVLPTVQSVGLNASREYTVANLAKGEDGSPAEQDVFLATTAAASLDWSAGVNKFVLGPNRVVVVGPGASTLRFQAASGAPLLGVAPAPVELTRAWG